jgi:hypothetical protein
MMKSSQKVGGAAAARWFSAAAPALFTRHPLSAVASTVSRRAARGTALAPAADTASSRLWFYVAPDAEDAAWAVMFDGPSQPFGYESQEDALTAACLAAEVMHRRHGTAAGVRLRAGSGWLDAVKFG